VFDSDSSNDCVQDCAEEWGGSAVVDNCGTCGGDGSSCGGIDYCLDLHSGANLVSFYGLLEDTSVDSMLSSVKGIAYGLIGEGVAANYNGSEWMGSLTNISPLSGYWAQVNNDCSICISDVTPTDPSIQFELHTGANLVSFPAEGSIDIAVALPDSIESYVVGIIGEGVAANYIDSEFLGSLSSFNGGQGYWMITGQSISFAYDVSSMSRIKFEDEVGLTAPDDKTIYQSTQQAFYFIEDVSLDGLPLSNGDWILSYNGKNLVGARQWNGGLTDVPAMGHDGNINRPLSWKGN
jgi:hypothetical protein